MVGTGKEVWPQPIGPRRSVGNASLSPKGALEGDHNIIALVEVSRRIIMKRTS